MGDLRESVMPLASAPPASRALPIREDCWIEEATSTLVDAWGRRYVELNKGNLRQKDWQEVADAVNALHGLTKKTHRTDVQCKNRIDTIKKKYKIEKARVLSSNGAFTSPWPFFDRLDDLIGSSFSAGSGGGSGGKNKQVSPSLSPSPPVAVAVPLPYRRTVAAANVNHSPFSAEVVALPPKRPRPVDDGYFRRNYSAMAAAAAAAESESEEEDEGEEEEVEVEVEVEGRGKGRGEGVYDDDEEDEREGMRRLARAIERFGQVYERVESEKLRQMVDLEKQRMKFSKDLEMERMRIFTETQIQLEKIRRDGNSGGGSGKRTGSAAGVGANGERDY